ncbi:MAG: hypothetical protein WED05_05315 [Candidatus Atabeyarchaeum deiterrae]
MDESTLCELEYSDVERSLAEDRQLLTLRLHRAKTNTDYTTFLGRDSVQALKAYLTDLKIRGIAIDFNTLLFLKESQKARYREGMATNLIEIMMKDVAMKAGFTNGEGFNNYGSHALGESFGCILTTKSVPDSVTAPTVRNSRKVFYATSETQPD